MSFSFQGISKADIVSGHVTQIEIGYSSSYQDVGRFRNARLNVGVIDDEGSPSGSMYVSALVFDVGFEIMQTDKVKELAMMAGTAGTGIYESDVQVRFTYGSGRIITLGAVAGYPLRLAMRLQTGNTDDSQYIVCEGTNIEPITALAAKVT